MAQRSFLPGPRVSNLIVALGVGALGWAVYMRYALLEQSTVGLVCDAGLATTTCAVRRAVITLHSYSVFGIVAVLAALVHLIRPSVITFTLALVATAIGVVLYNSNLAPLAAGLLLISFARPAPSARS
ncbi:hypothetical protein [Bosea sp. 117]|uniref:hypothetical protein n=1 Tax=Bosea sp. 117 TaxID=1125973 RepID=UPI00068BCE3E|nr:hypothetical protein [Bosea sp. 117]